MKSLINRKIIIFLIHIIIFDLCICKKVNNNFISFIDDENIITTIKSDNETEFLEAVEELNKNGGNIYIDTPVITFKDNCLIYIDGELRGGIIGIRQPNGEYPKIIFTINDYLEMLSGINIFGSNKFIEYIIIENSPGYGVTLYGDNNILEYVISRYNYGSGFAVYGDFNNLNYCYSYRNCDANIHRVKANGFNIVGGENNAFSYCFAWDNANSGFNFIRLFNFSELSYLHSGSWNNGNVNVFTGKYDYDNGNSLDKNLWTIKQIMESDPKFISNYYNKKYSIEDAYIDGLTVKEWTSKVSLNLEGNGFAFGSLNSSQIIDFQRCVRYCASFDHKSGGFIDTFNHKCETYITGCVSFNNGINYKIPFIWTENWSWGSKNSDQIKDGTTQKPSNENNARRSFYNTRDQIIKAVSANMFPDDINFDTSIGILRE